MKLYTTGDDSTTLLVRLAAKLMRTEDVQTVKVGDDAALKKKSITGRFPVLEDADGALVCDSLPIARYLARDNAQFTNGADAR